MADFQTFDLGRVLQTAQAIKGMRSQANTDRLREQYLGQQIETGRLQLDQQRVKFDQEQEKQKLSKGFAEISNILNAQNPVAAARSNTMLIETFRAAGGDVSQMQDDALIQSLRNRQIELASELGQVIAPISPRGKLVADQRAGFLTPEQVEAANAPKRPQSYEEHILAQKDPEFANFLRQRKGKGLSVTLPDGTVVEMGGDGSGVGPGELSKPTVNNLQETLVNSTSRLDRLNATLSTYKPEYLRAKGWIDANTTKLKDFVGMNVSPDDKAFLQGYTEFRANAANDFNQILKELSGTAVSQHEMPRLRQSMPSDKDTPAEFEAKARASTKFVTRAIMRANWALKNGIGVNSVNELSKRMPLEGIDGVYESRANQIWQELGGTPETKQQAIQQANTEFGLAR